MRLRPIGIFTVARARSAQRRLTGKAGGVPARDEAVNSGVTAEPGFSYSNNLLFYSRDTAKDDNGDTLPVTGHNAVLMDLNSFAWVSQKEILGGARYSAAVTLPVARNELESDVHDTISGGSGFADSYFLPIILGWNKERASFRVLFGFLAHRGQGQRARATPSATDVCALGPDDLLSDDNLLALLAYDVRLSHHSRRHRHASRRHFRSDAPLMRTFPVASGSGAPGGVAGYEQRQRSPRRGCRSPGPVTRALRGQRRRIGSERELPRAEAELEREVLRGIRQSLDIPGFLASVLGRDPILRARTFRPEGLT